MFKFKKTGFLESVPIYPVFFLDVIQNFIFADTRIKIEVLIVKTIIEYLYTILSKNSIIAVFVGIRQIP